MCVCVCVVVGAQVDAVAVPEGPDNTAGNAFTVLETDLLTESGRQPCSALLSARCWDALVAGLASTPASLPWLWAVGWVLAVETAALTSVFMCVYRGAARVQRLFWSVLEN